MTTPQDKAGGGGRIKDKALISFWGSLGTLGDQGGDEKKGRGWTKGHTAENPGVGEYVGSGYCHPPGGPGAGSKLGTETWVHLQVSQVQRLQQEQEFYCGSFCIA